MTPLSGAAAALLGVRRQLGALLCYLRSRPASAAGS